MVNSKERIEKFIDQNIVDISEQEILMPARRKIFQFGLSQNAANALIIEKKGFMKAVFKWDYKGPDGEPLSLWLENGFGKGGYDIHAKGRDFGGADHLKWKDENGKPVFRKKVRHPGFDGYHLVRDSWKETKPQLQRRMQEEIRNFLESNKL